MNTAAHLLILAVAAACSGPASATSWQTKTSSTTSKVSHCFEGGQPSCWVNYTNTHTAYVGYFADRQAAAAACSAMLDGATCGYASGEPGPPLMSGGWLTTCPGGYDKFKNCLATLHRLVTAYFPTLVIEQDVERPADCPSAGRQFGNPIDGLTGEKLETLHLTRWSTQATPLALHYRSGRFARQVGVSTLTGNNIPGLPSATGAHGLGIPDSGLSQPFGPLWTHALDSRATPVAGGVRLSRIEGSGGLSFRSQSNSSQLLPPSDQADRVQFLGGAGGVYWLHRDPRVLRTHYFSATGMLVHQVNADGTGRQWLRYSDSTTPRAVAAGPDRLLAVRDAFGRQLRLRYLRDLQGNATDLIAAITDDQGDSIAFEYDTARRLSLMRWPDGVTQRFTYDAMLPWALTTRIDEAGVATGNWTWNAATGLVASTAGAEGVNHHRLAFALAPQVVVTDTLDGPYLRRRYSWQPGTAAGVVRPNGSPVALGGTVRNGSLQLQSRSQPAGAGCNASTSTMTLDNNGNATVKDNFDGSRSCHAYDSARNLETVRVEGLDSSAQCEALLQDGAKLPPGARKITTRWHPVWPIPEVVASPGRIDTRVYNDRPDPFAAGAVARCMPWVGGGDLPTDAQPAALCRRVQRATSDSTGGQGLAAPLDTGVPSREERWTYTAQGQPSSHDGPRTDVADVTTWRYHGATTTLVRAGDLAEVRNSLGQVTRFNAWGPTGLLLSYSDANGVTTELAYDKRQRLTRVTEAAGTPWAAQTLHTWDPRGLLQQIEYPAVVGHHAAWGGSTPIRRIRYTYDWAHRLVGIVNDNQQGETYQLDPEGRVLTRTVHHGGQAQPSSTVFQRDFDALGRPWRDWSVIQGVPQATELMHDAMGRLISIQRPIVHSHGEAQAPREQRQYDRLGRLARIDSSVLGPQQATTLSHEGSGALSTVVSPNGARFQFDSDGFGQVRRARSVDSGETSQQFDAAGNLTSSTDAQGITTMHTYDALNRRIRTERRQGQSVGNSEHILYTWDSNPGGPLTCSHGIGRLCRIDDASGTRHFAYDEFGNQIEQLTIELGLSQRQTFGRDADGRLVEMSDDGGNVSLSRDAGGHARSIHSASTRGGSVNVHREGVRNDGDAATRRLGNGVIMERRFDTSGAISSQTDTGRPR